MKNLSTNINRTRKGKVVYIPPMVVDELKAIKIEMGVQHVRNKDSIAFRKLVERARDGRVMERAIKFNFKNNVRLPPLKSYTTKKYKNYKKRLII